MKTQTVLLILLLSFISCDNYAVLVAGSNSYSNYRHQSDIFHMYQILTKRGVNPDNIIVFAYDDIANNARNPFPGQMFNQPNGKDVYGGVVIDYFGKDVTPSNFIAAITGDADAVVKTDERSVVFSDTVVRVGENMALAMHIDTDESNAANCDANAQGEIIKI